MIIDMSIFDFADRTLINKAFDAGLFFHGIILNKYNSMGHVVCCGLTSDHICKPPLGVKTQVQISNLGQMYLETIED